MHEQIVSTQIKLLSSHHIFEPSFSSQMDLFQFSDQFSKKLWCQNILGDCCNFFDVFLLLKEALFYRIQLMGSQFKSLHAG